jgi:hypothetical protein
MSGFFDGGIVSLRFGNVRCETADSGCSSASALKKSGKKLKKELDERH